MNNHIEFIIKPITSVLKEVVNASSGVGTGIETYPLYDYITQSVFLKMTGFQEQKMKCICWELATFDYDYRYIFLKKPLGECSTYEEKQIIYKTVVNQLEKYGVAFRNLEIDRVNILTNTISDITDTFANTNLSIWAQKDYINFHTIIKEIKVNHFANEKNSLFSSENLYRMYENHLYKQRNRIAHNTLSYQQNLPTLKNLIHEEFKYDNYFLYFAILILIDKIFIELYNKYLNVIEDKK